MLFHPEAEKAFNSKAFKLVSLIEEKKIEIEYQPLQGSSANRVPLDLGDAIKEVRGQISSKINHSNIISSLSEIIDDKEVGYSSQNYPQFEKFVDDIYKIKNVSKKISPEFLNALTFKWLLNIYLTKKAESNYCQYLLSKVTEVSKDYKFYFKVLHLDIQKEFKIGNVEFGFVTPAFFDKYINPRNDNKDARQEFQGNVYVSFCVLNAEEQRAREIAYDECVKAMDVFKLFAPTVNTPDFILSYDIDKRVNAHQQSSSFTQNLNNDLDFTINLNSLCRPITFGVTAIDNIEKTVKKLETLICLPEPNELQQLIINSLNRFSEALSNRNIHKRIVDIFTIWESLLLKNGSVGILDTVSQYSSKLLYKTVEDRINFISFFKQMYDIRSAMVHHAKLKKLDLKQVAKFQMHTIYLIEALITQSERHLSKQSMLDEIDHAIHSAY
jgi:hypothetical protein